MNHRLTPVAFAVGVAFALPAQAEGEPATTTLPSVVVSGTRVPYAGGPTRAATRTDTPVEQVPQSIVTLPKALLEDQGSRTLDAALRNASNVNTVDSRDANNVVFKIRGFTAATVVDGVAMPGYFPAQESLVNIERIDVIKGPAGDLFGSSQGQGSYGSLGGTIAITTAEPGPAPVRRLHLRLGTPGERGLGFDVNQPIGTDWAVRLAGEVSRTGSETDRVSFRRQALFPSLAWTPGPDTKVVLRARYLDNRTLDYSGLPVNGTLDTSTDTLPRRTMIAATDQPDTVTTARGVHLQWTQRLAPDWNFDLTLARQHAEVDQRGSWLVPATGMMGCFGFGSATPGATNLLCGARMWDRFTTTTLSPSLTGRIEHDGVRHTLSTGLDLERTRDDAFMIYSNLLGPIAMTPVSPIDASLPAWVEPTAPATPDQQNRYRSRVVYLQDQLGPRVNAPLAQAKRASSSVATRSQACASWFAQGLVACLHSSWRQPSIQHTGAHAHAVTCHHRPNWALQGTLIRRIASATPYGRP